MALTSWQTQLLFVESSVLMKMALARCEPDLLQVLASNLSGSWSLDLVPQSAAGIVFISLLCYLPELVCRSFTGEASNGFGSFEQFVSPFICYLRRSKYFLLGQQISETETHLR